MTDSHRPTELPIELPPEDADALFDIPDDGIPLGPRGPADLPGFDIPEELPVPMVSTPEVLPPAGGVPELVITPEEDTYLELVERAVQPYIRESHAFEQQMRAAAIDTPEKLQWLGQQSLIAKTKEQAIEAVFEPAIRKPRLYLDRVYGLRRAVMGGFTRGGEMAAKRYAARQRELEDLDRKAKAEADRRARAQQQEADRMAAIERRRLVDEAAKAAQVGQVDVAADLIDQARAVEAEQIAPVEAPPSQAEASKVAGVSSRQDWQGAIVDIKTAVLASARPDILREVADAIGSGEFTAGGQTITTEMIATKLRALALEQPIIPSSMFMGNPETLKARAVADKDTLSWPGFQFTLTTTPVRRPGARRNLAP